MIYPHHQITSVNFKSQVKLKCFGNLNLKMWFKWLDTGPVIGRCPLYQWTSID